MLSAWASAAAADPTSSAVAATATSRRTAARGEAVIDVTSTEGGLADLGAAWQLERGGRRRSSGLTHRTDPPPLRPGGCPYKRTRENPRAVLTAHAGSERLGAAPPRTAGRARSSSTGGAESVPLTSRARRER